MTLPNMKTQQSMRIIDGAPCQVTTVDGFDRDQINDRLAYLSQRIDKLKRKFNKFCEMRDAIDIEDSNIDDYFEDDAFDQLTQQWHEDDLLGIVN